MTQKTDTATATLRCPDGCFSIEYEATHKGPDVDPKTFLNELGPPQGVQMTGGKSACPSCSSALTVVWGDGDD